MKIGHKSILGFVGIASLVGVVGACCILHNKRAQNIAEEQVYKSISHLDDVWKLMEAQEHQEIAACNYLFLDTGLEGRRADYFYEKTRAEETCQRYSTMACEYAEPLIEKYYDNIKIYNTKIEEAFELHRQGAHLELIKEKVREANKYIETAHEDALEPIIEHVHKVHIEPAKENVAKGIRRTTNVTITVSVIAVILAVGLGLFISYSISGPLKKLGSATAEIGKGKLDTKIEFTSNDEISKLAQSFNEMAYDLKEYHANLETKVKERTSELRSEVRQRTSAKKVLEQRIKEINCLYELSRLIERPQISFDQILQETAELIRSTYRHPDITCVRITFSGIDYKTDNFAITESSQSAHINVQGEKVGTIKVYYLGEKQRDDEAPFLKEEQICWMRLLSVSA